MLLPFLLVLAAGVGGALLLAARRRIRDLESTLETASRDRERVQSAAANLIESGDRERAAFAVELRDSTAQRLAALLLNVSAAARDAISPEIAARLQAIRDAAEEVTDEVRTLAQTIHPRVLDDLGLVAALRRLGRDASAGTEIEVDVKAGPEIDSLPRAASSTIFHVAQEAVRNAVDHARPKHIRMTVAIDAASIRLEVSDDGRGFDYASDEQRESGSGLIAMRDRLTVFDGTLEIRSASGGGGTTIVATIPRSRDETRKESR